SEKFHDSFKGAEFSIRPRVFASGRVPSRTDGLKNFRRSPEWRRRRSDSSSAPAIRAVAKKTGPCENALPAHSTRRRSFDQVKIPFANSPMKQRKDDQRPCRVSSSA